MENALQKHSWENGGKTNHGVVRLEKEKKTM